MNGTFNGIQLRNILAKTIEATPGFERTSFRIISEPSPELEATLHLNAQAILILATEEIEGRIVHYSADVHSGYTITLEPLLPMRRRVYL